MKANVIASFEFLRVPVIRFNFDSNNENINGSSMVISSALVRNERTRISCAKCSLIGAPFSANQIDGINMVDQETRPKFFQSSSAANGKTGYDRLAFVVELYCCNGKFLSITSNVQNKDANAASIAEPFRFNNISRPASAQLGYSLPLTSTANFECKTSAFNRGRPNINVTDTAAINNNIDIAAIKNCLRVKYMVEDLYSEECFT
ncbi:hypothetical protein DERF_009526 [Dermatophagoides farinae]|uniref:Uncharacterized protein n=1 Tax=Dermatophagoides farinae TaxID=6954 RepID=A0A922HU52_DERFA|nr:hypothetical protein DERF_009526 [Dermatophagoides farinae]